MLKFEISLPASARFFDRLGQGSAMIVNHELPLLPKGLLVEVTGRTVIAHHDHQNLQFCPVTVYTVGQAYSGFIRLDEMPLNFIDYIVQYAS